MPSEYIFFYAHRVVGIFRVCVCAKKALQPLRFMFEEEPLEWGFLHNMSTAAALRAPSPGGAEPVLQVFYEFTNFTLPAGFSPTRPAVPPYARSSGRPLPGS